MRFGVDEAGRGPVLGSLFVACVRADPADLPAGIDDSKRLSSARRKALAAELRADDGISTAVVEVTPDEIDDPGIDINALTVAAAAEAIERVVEDGLSGVVDACDTDAARFGRRVSRRRRARSRSRPNTGPTRITRSPVRRASSRRSLVIRTSTGWPTNTARSAAATRAIRTLENFFGSTSVKPVTFHRSRARRGRPVGTCSTRRLNRRSRIFKRAI